MEEVVDLENKIRDLLPKVKRSKPRAAVVSDAEAIMSGRPTTIQGTRLDRLRKIVEMLSHKENQ